MSTAAISLPRLARHNPLAAAGVVLVAVFVICALFAPWIAPQDPAHIDLPNRLQPPSAQHLCGTDELGRAFFPPDLGRAHLDVCWQQCSCVSFRRPHHRQPCGILWRPHRPLRQHRADECFSFFSGILIGVPLSLSRTCILNLYSRSLEDGSAMRAWFALRCWPAERKFVEAARGLGERLRIILRHILLNIIQPVIVQAAIGWQARFRRGDHEFWRASRRRRPLGFRTTRVRICSRALSGVVSG